MNSVCSGFKHSFLETGSFRSVDRFGLLLSPKRKIIAYVLGRNFSKIAVFSGSMDRSPILLKPNVTTIVLLEGIIVSLNLSSRRNRVVFEQETYFQHYVDTTKMRLLTGQASMINVMHVWKFMLSRQHFIFATLISSTPVVPWLSYSTLDPRFGGSHPAAIDGFFQSVKILIMTFFGREVKPWEPCRRFTTRKRTSSRN